MKKGATMSRLSCVLESGLFHDRETILANAAERAGPTVGNGLKRSARGDAAIGVAFFWVINVTTDIANVFLHGFNLLIIN